jgi:hypothetical protein
MLRESIIALLLSLFISADGITASIWQNGSQNNVLRAAGPVTSGMGISTHSTADSDLDGMKAVGFNFVRIDFRWDRVESTPGVYNWEETDRRVAAIAERGMRPIMILDYSNPIYTTEAPGARTRWNAPHDPKSIRAFSDWAARAARRYARFNPVWELWNEPDTADLWPPRANPNAYLALAESSCTAIRAVDSRATIWGPALSSQHHLSALASPFLKQVLASSLPACLSAISVHPYAFWSEIDRAPDYWNAVRRMPVRTARPFVSSESGISNYGTRITAATQASYLARMFIYDHMAHIPVSIWYDWRDDGRDPLEPEHHFGLLDVNGKPKPAYVALATLVHQTAGLDRQCLVQNNSRSLLYDWQVDRPNQIVLIAWATTQGLKGLSTDPTGPISVPLPAAKGTPTAVDFSGHPASIREIGPDSWQIDGGGQPYYVRYAGTLPAACS